MSAVRKRAVENAEQILGSLIVGAGFIALFAGFNYFFLIWILGFAVLLPVIGALTGEDESNEIDSKHDTRPLNERSDANGDSTPDALATLRDRYARGELADDQFERKLDALLETESPETAAEWRTRDPERVEERS